MVNILMPFILKPNFLKIHNLSTGIVLAAIYIISFFGPVNSFAGNKTDSLINILNTKDLSDSEQSILYSKIAKSYLNTNLDSARYFAMKGLNLAKKSDNIDGALKNYLALGLIALKADSIIVARNYYLEAIKFTGKTNNNNSILTAYLNLGYSCDLLSDYGNSMEYYYKGLHIADSLNLKTIQSRFYNNIAIIYNKTGNDRKAINYYFRAAAIFKEIGKEDYYANILLNIGEIYSSLDSIDSALFYLNKSKEINERLNNHYGLLNYYANVGEIDFEAGEYEKALINFQLQIEEINKLDDSFFGSRSYLKTGVLIHFGNTYSKLGEFEKAIKSYHEAMQLAKKSSFLKYISSIGEGLSEVFERTGNLDSAFVYYKLFQKYNDSLKKEETLKNIAKIEMDYKLQQERKMMEFDKERMESEQKAKGLIYLSIIGASISGLLLFMLLYVRQKNIHKQSLLKEQNLQLEKENLANELEYKNKELTTNVMYLLKKNEFISDISNKLKGVDCDSDQMEPKVIVDIINELDKNTSKEVWTEFETRFQDIYGDFYKRLNEKFPDLTPNELKLSAFLKLNMSSKEISSITYQSGDTLRKARFRLRKKLGLNREDNLMAFLNQI